MKLRSTTTGVDVGLRSETYSPSPFAVVPPGKYHDADVVLWHGDWDQPEDPCTACVTATPPPETDTISDSQDPVDNAGMDGATTLAAGTATAVRSEEPPSVTVVIVPETGPLDVLVRTRRPGDTPEAVDCPVQYQADDSASGAGTSAPGAAGAPSGAAVPRVLLPMPTPASTSTTRASTRHRRSLL
jgi:hypothetical protein